MRQHLRTFETAAAALIVIVKRAIQVGGSTLAALACQNSSFAAALSKPEITHPHSLFQAPLGHLDDLIGSVLRAHTTSLSALPVASRESVPRSDLVPWIATPRASEAASGNVGSALSRGQRLGLTSMFGLLSELVTIPPLSADEPGVDACPTPDASGQRHLNAFAANQECFAPAFRDYFIPVVLGGLNLSRRYPNLLNRPRDSGTRSLLLVPRSHRTHQPTSIPLRRRCISRARE